MRVIGVSTRGILDSLTGEYTEALDLEKLLITEPGGVIAGNNLYPILAKLAPRIRQDEGWTMSVNMQQRKSKPLDSETRLTGKMYISRLTYRRGKVGGRKNRRRPPAIKWVVLELGLFTETPPVDLDGIIEAGRSLIALANRRGIKPRPSPGSFGAAMLRASPKWNRERRPAPSFVSQVAREHLPGNYYALSHELRGKRFDHVYYMDQDSAHHKIAASIPLPHPHTLRARGYFRATEEGIHRKWTHYPSNLHGHVGLICAQIGCSVLPRELEHLYPPWAKAPGRKPRWIWTPELRLFQDHRIDLEYVICALTSRFDDDALNEYANWSLKERSRDDAPTYKSSLLAAYGMLACRSDLPIQTLTVHGRGPSPRQTVVQLPLLPTVYRSEVHRKRTPAIQNVVARGVIEAETRTRSIEYARRLERENVKVAHVYADGLLAVGDETLFPRFAVPEHWRVAANLTRVFSPHPNSIISDQLVRLPGILGSAQEAYASAWEPGPIRAVMQAREARNEV